MGFLANNALTMASPPAERAALRVALHAGQVPNRVTNDMFAELQAHFGEQQQLDAREPRA